jgi:hypothetical protein
MMRQGLKMLLAMSLVMPAALHAQSSWELENRENWIFPDSMKVQNVKQVFGAVGDGKTDDTAALQKAFDQTNTFVYLPNGTYIVRDRLIWNGKPGVGPTIQGQSRDGVVIRLAPDAKGFGDPNNPKPLIQLVPGGPKDKLSADFFKTRLRNLTIDAGKHKGAIGLIFYANNNGMLRNVRIVGDGVAGLDLSRQLNGPLLASNIQVEGFDKGIVAGTGPFNSQTLEHVILSGQKSYGLYNGGELLSVRDLHSVNACPAVFTHGVLVLLDAVLESTTAGTAAVVAARQVHVRNLQTKGYRQAMEYRNYDRKAGMGELVASVPGGKVDEWASTSPKGDVRLESLNLPAETAPYEPLPPHDQWVVVSDFGADGKDKEDDTAAVQKAIDAAMKGGKSVVAFPEGRFQLSGTLTIGGSIRRLQGAHAYLVPPAGQALEIRIAEGSSPLVIMDLIDRPLGRHAVVINNASGRTVVIRNFRGELHATGPGKTFCEDSVSSLDITHPQARVWVRQLNSEGTGEVFNHNRGGMLWVLGLKTERVGTLLATSGGGSSEILGGWVYVIGKEPPTRPMFEIEKGQLTLTGIHQYHYRGLMYDVLVATPAGARTPTLLRSANRTGGAVVHFTGRVE